MFIQKLVSVSRRFPALLVPLGLAWAVNSHATSAVNEQQALSEIYQQAVASPIRTDEDREADAKRKPLEFLQFTDVRPGMQVLDIAAGGGYTTQLLALVVGSKGTVWAQKTKPGRRLEERLASHPQPNIVPVIRPFEDPIPDDAPKLDLITIIMNYHDIAYMPVDRAKMNKRLFDALKPGGHLVVLDHSAKAGSGISEAKSLHRIDEKVVMDEVSASRFQAGTGRRFHEKSGRPARPGFLRHERSRRTNSHCASSSPEVSHHVRVRKRQRKNAMNTTLITGANRGIGLEFCRQYAADGWRVLACCRYPEKSDALNKLASQYPGLIKIHALDVGDHVADRAPGAGSGRRIR